MGVGMNNKTSKFLAMIFTLGMSIFWVSLVFKVFYDYNRWIKLAIFSIVFLYSVFNFAVMDRITDTILYNKSLYKKSNKQ